MRQTPQEACALRIRYSCRYCYIWQEQTPIYSVSQKVTTLACYNFDVHQPILIIFESNFAKKVNNLTVLCIAVAVL